MAGDVDLQILNDMEFGRAYFSRDGVLDANDRSKFCPFDHPPSLIKQIPIITDGELRVLSLRADVTDKIVEIANTIKLTELLIENQRLHARRFKLNKLRYRR